MYIYVNICICVYICVYMYICKYVYIHIYFYYIQWIGTNQNDFAISHKTSRKKQTEREKKTKVFCF